MKNSKRCPDCGNVYACPCDFIGIRAKRKYDDLLHELQSIVGLLAENQHNDNEIDYDDEIEREFGLPGLGWRIRQSREAIERAKS